MCKPTKNKIYCPECRRSKMLFESETKANTFIKFNKDNIENGNKLRPYFCECCGGWHITHSIYNENRDRQVKSIIDTHLMSKERTKVRKLLNKEKVDNILLDIKKHNICTKEQLNIFLDNNYTDTPRNIIITAIREFNIELKRKYKY